MTRVVGVVLRPGAPEALEALRSVQEKYPEVQILVEAEGHHALSDVPEGVRPVSVETFENESDLVLVFGGDGTLIHAASLLKSRVVPILGINMGHIGFLTEVTLDEVHSALELALDGGLPHVDRLRLDVEILRRIEGSPRVVFSHRILNDTVLSPQAIARIATYRVELEGELVTMIRGDGVIISTPTGSTAYGMAAGGSILTPGLEAIAIVPLCPHQLSQRPIVLRPDGELSISLEGESTVFATCDGQRGQAFAPGDRMVIRRAPVATRVLSVPWRGYFQTLRTKLGWGDG